MTKTYFINFFKEFRSRILMYCESSINYLFTNCIQFFRNRF